MIADRPLFGIILMIGFCVLAPLGDAIAKLLGDIIPLGMLLLVRFAVQALILLPVLLLSGKPVRMSRRIFTLTFVRTVLHIIGIGAMFMSLRFLPLADALAIAFVMPFIILLLGRYVLGEEVGSRRILACMVGFFGTLLVIQPSFSDVGWPALLPLVVALVFALFMLVTRHIAKQVDPIQLQAIGGIIATAGLLIAYFASDALMLIEMQLAMPGAREFWLLMILGVLGTLAHLLMTWSLRFTPASTLAPVQYLEIPFATVIGWLVFKDFPNGLAAIGIAITMAAGLFIVFREKEAAQAVPPEV